MYPYHLPQSLLVRQSFLLAAFLGVCVVVPAAMTAQSVPPELVSPAAGPPQAGARGEKLVGMPKFHDPAPYDIDAHTGYKQIFDGKSLAGWDADPRSGASKKA